MVAPDYDKLESFLKGEVSLGDLDTRQFDRFDVTLIAYALAIPHLGELTHGFDGQLYLKEAIHKMLNRHCPYYLHGGYADASRKLGLHVTEYRGGSTKLTLPARLVELVNQYKDLPEGGIAKFTALKAEALRGQASEDGITPGEVAADVVARLHRVYGNDVLELIRRTL